MTDTERSLYVQDANGTTYLLEPVMWSDANEWHGELPQEADVTLYRMSATPRAHQSSDDCWCGPTSEPVKREDGSVGWVVVHNEGGDPS